MATEIVSSAREGALSKIAGFTAKYGEDASKLGGPNEAVTRLLLIDSVLQAIGWSKEEFNAEAKTDDGQFLDYALAVDGVPRLIVEAKRVGGTFATTRDLRKTEYTVKYVQSAFGAPFSEVLEQTRTYCLQTRIPYAVITNGLHWFLLDLLSPTPNKVKDQKCFYFGNLLSEAWNFELLWSLVSKSAVAGRQLETQLHALNPLEADYSIEPRVKLGEMRWGGGQHNNRFIGQYYNYFFDEIVDPGRRNMLTHCYVSNSRLDQYERLLKTTLSDSAPAFMDNAEELSPGDHHRLLLEETGDQKGRVILVAGAVGAGKTTFLTKATVEFRDRDDFCLVFVDLIDEMDYAGVAAGERLWRMTRDSWVAKEPNAVRYEALTGVFHQELEELRHGPKAHVFAVNEEAYVEDEARVLGKTAENDEKLITKGWRYWRKQKRRNIVLFLDNVDRLSESYQKEVYGFAHRVADAAGATVVVTMRESTYFRGKSSGFLDVRTSDLVCHLQAPDLLQLLSKRVNYIEHHLEEDYRLKKWKRADSYSDFMLYAGEFTTLIRDTFLKGDDVSRATLLGSVAWHSVRGFLESLRRLHKFFGLAQKPWSAEEILFALMTPGEAEAERLVSPDLFRPVLERQRCYFLNVRLLLFLTFGASGTERRRGVAYERIVEFARAYGYRELWTGRALERLVRSRSLECLQIPTDEELTRDYELDTKHNFRSSPLGAVTVDKMMTDPVFLTISGWRLPFYEREAASKYETAMMGFVSRLDAMDRNDVSALANSTLPCLVAEYLLSCLQYEPVRSPHLLALPEVRAVEDRILKAANDWRALAGVEDSVSAPANESGDHLTGDLFSDDPRIEKVEIAREIPLPAGIEETSISGSTSLPRVLWALVYLKANGSDDAIGIEITRTINEHLLDDDHRIEPTNLSRALRSPVLVAEPWLKIRQGKSRGNLFGLNEGWEEFWEEYFGTEAPNISL